MNIRKEELLQFLASNSGSKTLSGIFQEHSYTEKRPSRGIKTIESFTGVFPGVVTTLMPSFHDDDSQWQLFVDEAIFNWNNGSLVNIIWFDDQHPLAVNDMTVQIFSKTPNVDLEEAEWESLMEAEGTLNTLWKKHLDIIAPFLLQLQNAGVIVICDLLPFLHLKHLFWRGRPGVNGTVKLYQTTQDYFKMHHGLTSLVWMWSLHHSGDMIQLQEYWPGDEYVDVVSVYMGNVKGFRSDVYQKILNVINGKPIALECAYSVPSHYLLLHVQPQWAWFTIYDYFLKNEKYNNNKIIKNIFHNLSIVNRGNLILAFENFVLTN